MFYLGYPKSALLSWLIILGWSFPAWLLQATTNTERPPQPNIVFILIDDLGYSDLQINTKRQHLHLTPHIDQLARQGTRFTNSYAASPVCSPTRASILTGKHPVATGITDWIPGEQQPRNRAVVTQSTEKQLKLEEETLPEVLTKNGYQTAFIGKWHLGEKDFYPETQGFTTNIAGSNVGRPKWGYHSPYFLENLKNGPIGEYLTDRLTDEAISQIDQMTRNPKPFFLFLSYYSMHSPIEPKDAFLTLSFKNRLRKLLQEDPKLPWKNASYASMLNTLDTNIGKLVQALSDRNLTTSTLVVFHSDNGGHTGTNNFPFRGHKGSMYEGGLRVPSFFTWPGTIPANKEMATPIISMDFFPTLVEIAGLEFEAQALGGHSLTPLLFGDKTTLDRPALFWHFPHFRKNAPIMPASAIRFGNEKLIQIFAEDRFELYNLKDDPGEQNDLATVYPQRTLELAKMLKAWQTRTGAVIPIKAGTAQ